MQTQIGEMPPAKVHDAVRDHRVVLSNVRQPQQYADERRQGARLFGSVTCAPSALRIGERPAALQCGTGQAGDRK